MPQMGESIAEGTITKWLKQVGERVERDEPLFEISTDKVDAEIPSPAAGTLQEVLFKEGETVEVNKVVAIIGDGAGAESAAAPADSASAAATPPSPANAPPVSPASQAAVAAPPPPQPPPTATTTPAPSQSDASSSPSPQTPAAAPPPASATAASASSSSSAQPSSGDNGGTRPTAEQTRDELRRTRSSPLVRKIAQEHNIDISQLEGTGTSGRVTKNDILSFIESGTAAPSAVAAAPSSSSSSSTSSAPAAAAQAAAVPTTQAPQTASVQPGEGDRVETMSVMRRKIAEHMTMSQRTSAHVAIVYEIDMTRIARLRDEHKKSFQERAGTKLTFMPFIFQAVTQAIRKFPVFNSQVSGDQIVYKRDINLGMAVALDWGLIVPVIKRADDLSISGLARAANDLADRARAKQLKPDEVAGGTFTITNPGVFGGLFGTPIINQPQVAILGIGTIEKRPKVITTPEGDDLIAIRTMAYFALSFDHRIIDGADAERFLGYIKQLLEAGQFSV